MISPKITFEKNAEYNGHIAITIKIYFFLLSRRTTTSGLFQRRAGFKVFKSKPFDNKCLLFQRPLSREEKKASIALMRSTTLIENIRSLINHSGYKKVYLFRYMTKCRMGKKIIAENDFAKFFPTEITKKCVSVLCVSIKQQTVAT